MLNDGLEDQMSIGVVECTDEGLPFDVAVSVKHIRLSGRDVVRYG